MLGCKKLRSSTAEFACLQHWASWFRSCSPSHGPISPKASLQWMRTVRHNKEELWIKFRAEEDDILTDLCLYKNRLLREDWWTRSGQPFHFWLGSDHWCRRSAGDNGGQEGTRRLWV